MNAPDPSLEPARRAALEARILAVARSRPVDERVPAGFSRRVQQHLTQRPPEELLGSWTRGLWQALIPALGCLAVVAWLQPRNPGEAVHESETDVDAAAEISLWDALDATTGEVEL